MKTKLKVVTVLLALAASVQVIYAYAQETQVNQLSQEDRTEIILDMLENPDLANNPEFKSLFVDSVLKYLKDIDAQKELLEQLKKKKGINVPDINASREPGI